MSVQNPCMLLAECTRKSFPYLSMVKQRQIVCQTFQNWTNCTLAELRVIEKIEHSKERECAKNSRPCQWSLI